jgi:hypothetical protein
MKEPVEFQFTKPPTPECFKADLQLNYYLRKNFKSKDAKKLVKRCYAMVEKLHKVGLKSAIFILF